MKKTFKAHPLMIFTFIKPFLFILLIPVVRGIVQYIQYGHIERILGLEIIVFGIIILFGVLRWRLFKLTCDEKNVTIKMGAVLVKEAVIPISGLSSIQSKQNPIDYVFRSVTYNINTEAGSRHRTDYSFKLSRKDSRELSQLLYGPKTAEPIRFSAVKIAILAAATSSALTGLLVGIPILNNAAKLFGIGFNELYDEINSVTVKFQSYFPPIVNTVTLILLGAYLVSFVYCFLKYINLRFFLEKDRFEIRSGFFVKTRTSFKFSSVNDVKIEQTFLMTVLRRFAMKVNVGGYGEQKSESQVLVPSGKYEEVKARFSEYFPFFKTNKNKIKSKKGFIHENRYLFWAEIYFILLGIATALTIKFFTEFDELIFFLTFVVSLVIVYYAYLCVLEYKNGSVALGDTVSAAGIKGLRFCRLYCPKDRVGEIKLIRYPFDKFYDTCNVRIIIRSETADNILVRHLDFEKTKKEIYKTYNIHE